MLDVEVPLISEPISYWYGPWRIRGEGVANRAVASSQTPRFFSDFLLKIWFFAILENHKKPTQSIKPTPLTRRVRKLTIISAGF